MANENEIHEGRSWGYSEGHSTGDGVTHGKTLSLGWTGDEEMPDGFRRSMEEEADFLRRALGKLPGGGFADGAGI